MSHAGKDSAWITVHTHMNIVAVAVLSEIACIIIPEGIEAEEATIKRRFRRISRYCVPDSPLMKCAVSPTTAVFEQSYSRGEHSGIPKAQQPGQSGESCSDLSDIMPLPGEDT